ncbi:MAG: peptidylprolyl isomerase [Eggerthellaceae bacterium]|nr:peptidylprolyl isomerase [Eggerthellaceae bacterium]
MKTKPLKTKQITLIVVVVLLTAALGFGIYSFIAGENSPFKRDTVAATVNGVPVMESTVTDFITSIRTSSGYEDDSIWALWLYIYGYTPETLRNEVVHYFIDRLLVIQYAKANGLAPDEEAINSYVNTMKSYYESEEAWQAALATAGYTEQTYRDAIEYSQCYEAVFETFAHNAELTEDEIMAGVETYSSTIDESRLPRHILFDAEDTATAATVAAQIKAGSLSWNAAVLQYSTDEATKNNGGLLPWDCLSSYAEEFQTALEALAEGETSDPVTSSFGIHIIKCEQLLNVNTIHSSADLPDEILDTLKANIKNDMQNKAYDEAIGAFEKESTISINVMPKHLPYDVDMSAYDNLDNDDHDHDHEGEGEEQ